MEFQQNFNDIIEELNSALFSLQTDLGKVMNGINQLNLIISKLKNCQVNNNMMNNMMNNINNNINNINMRMNMINMQEMNMPIQVNPMMNFNFEKINVEPDFSRHWNLYFEKDIEKTTVFIDPEKLVKEAIDMYLKKKGIDIDRKNLRFLYNGKHINPEIKINQSGLIPNSKIFVFELHDPCYS